MGVSTVCAPTMSISKANKKQILCYNALFAAGKECISFRFEIYYGL